MRLGVSVSTLRRRIKGNQVSFKVDQGRYLVWSEAIANGSDSSDSELERVKKELRKAKEEIAELKMLVALYEQDQVPKAMDLT